MSKELHLIVTLLLILLGGMIFLNGLTTPESVQVSVMSTSVVNMDLSGVRTTSIIVGTLLIIGGLAVGILIKPKPDEN